MIRNRRQRGMTLIELTVAMAIGLFLIGGALYVYAQSKNSYRASDSLARLQEAARFALDTLEPDIRLTRYWGLTSEPAQIERRPPGIVVSCAGTDASDFALGAPPAIPPPLPPLPIEVRDDTYNLPCVSFNNAPRAGSDVLVLRHAEPWKDGNRPLADGNRVQVQTTLAQGRLFKAVNLPLGPADGTNSTNNVIVNAYYVSNESGFDPALPSLRRLSLGANGNFRDEEIIPGVENLQVQFGIDTDDNNDVDRYVDGDHALLDPAAAGYDPDDQVIAVRLWLLIGTPADDPAWVDERSYTTPDANLGALVGGSASYPANFRRLQISKTIFLNNEGA